MDPRAELLRDLTEAPGASGFEDSVRQIARAACAPLGEVSRDGLGSLLITAPGSGSASAPRVLLGAHMDEVGFLITRVTPEGFLRFQTLGGWWEQVMLAQRVHVISRRGPVLGIVGSKPPHVLPAEARKKVVEKAEMFIDIGAGSAADVEAMGVRPGDFAVPVCPFAELGQLYAGKAFDDRAGCALVIEAMRAARGSHPNTLIGALTVQEETGLRGAQTSVTAARPDVAISLDVGIAGDTPGMKPEEAQARLGGGPVALLYDGSLIPNPRLRDLVADTAAQAGIPFQYDLIPGGGNDGGRFQQFGQGVPTICLGIPARYIHSATSVISRSDFDHAVDLLAALVRRLDQAAIRGLTP
ncbi:MAG TPA: M42 family metallopeptidase [Bacillota bacterium]|nr:M42 family metallopeptidase [Bacillota bacterium]